MNELNHSVERIRFCHFEEWKNGEARSTKVALNFHEKISFYLNWRKSVDVVKLEFGIINEISTRDTILGEN